MPDDLRPGGPPDLRRRFRRRMIGLIAIVVAIGLAFLIAIVATSGQRPTHPAGASSLAPPTHSVVASAPAVRIGPPLAAA